MPRPAHLRLVERPAFDPQFVTNEVDLSSSQYSYYPQTLESIAPVGGSFTQSSRPSWDDDSTRYLGLL